MTSLWQGPVNRVADVWSALRANVAPFVGAGGVIWRAVEPMALGFVVLVAVMGTACVTCGAVLRHVALGGTSS